jgi:hypothetical protein
MNKDLLSLFVCLIFLSKGTKAQHAYIPIPEDSAIWITEVEDWHEGQGPMPHTFSYTLGFTKGIDTVINGQRYAYYFGEFPNWYVPVPSFEFSTLYGAWFYQDTTSKKVWFVQIKTFPELAKVLFDFSLQVGDTITDSLNLWLSPTVLYPYKAWVEAVDSLYFPDNTWRYRWHIRSNYGNLSNVE